MSTPTDQQQIRATLRRASRNIGLDAAAAMMFDQACDVLGVAPVVQALANKGWQFGEPDGPLPPLLGASEAADVLGMKATNLKRLSPPLPVAAVISGRIPVYRESDVLAAKQRRDARRAAA